MANKLRVGILFGGRSGEHEVSLLSAASVLNAIDRSKFDVVPIGITREGRWLAAADAHKLLLGDSSAVARRLRAGDPEATPGAKLLHEGIPTLMSPMPGPQGTPLDVVFPVLHGTFGEDGTIQGLFELAGIAYVGSGVLGSAAGMDKDVMKRLFAAGRPAHRQARHPAPRRLAEIAAQSPSPQVEKALKYPVFVKPANLGSSVGISKAHNRKELAPRARRSPPDTTASSSSNTASAARNPAPASSKSPSSATTRPKASVVGEIVPGKEFYDYEAKYLSEGSVPIIPAKLTRAQTKTIREMAIAAFRACDLAGLARVDFLMEPARQTPHFPQRGQYPARLHQDQHVPQAVGSLRPQLHQPHHPPHRARPRAPAGQEPQQLQPGTVISGQ